MGWGKKKAGCEFCLVLTKRHGPEQILHSLTELAKSSKTKETHKLRGFTLQLKALVSNKVFSTSSTAAVHQLIKKSYNWKVSFYV